MGNGVSGGVDPRTLTVEQVAACVEGLGSSAAFAKVAASVRENGVDAAVIIDYGKDKVDELINDIGAEGNLIKKKLKCTLTELIEAMDARDVADQHQEHPMPEGPLADFTPISTMPNIHKMVHSNDMQQSEQALQSSPKDEAVIIALTEAVKELAHAITFASHDRCERKNVTPQLHAVVGAGNAHFKPVYDAVWGTVQAETKGCEAYKAAVGTLKFPGASAVQNAVEPVGLLQQAALAKKLYDQVIPTLLANVDGVELNIPSTLKKVGRIIEKSVLNPAAPGNCNRIFDVVRGMCVCRTMKGVAEVVSALGKCGKITLVRAKERFFAQPSPGGWRDFMVCFFINEDSNKHICELQCVHSNLLTARKGLPGHAVYNCVRNAAELLEMQWHCRRVFNWTVDDAKRAGFSEDDLKRAGFTEAEIKGAGSNGGGGGGGAAAAAKAAPSPAPAPAAAAAAKPSGPVNRAGVPVAPGKGKCSMVMYCGRRLGTAVIPHSDGGCGPTNGPQCPDCAALNGLNNAGAPMKFGRKNGTGILYCGRFLGKKAIPGSDGHCGPTNGPQCNDCKTAPKGGCKLSAPPKCGKGHVMKPSTYSKQGYEGGYICNHCRGYSRKGLNGGSRERWFCQLCKDDYCYSCVPKVVKNPAAKIPKCKKGHAMEPSTYSEGGYKGGYVCDKCRGASSKGHRGGSRIRWFCKNCKSDFCFNCNPGP